MANKSKGCFTNRDGPGPANYSINLAHKIKGGIIANRYKEGSSRKSSLDPGPGAYKANYQTTTKGMPKTVFCRAQRDKNTFYSTANKFNPGPGSY